MSLKGFTASKDTSKTADMNKVFGAKRKYLKSFTNSSLQTSQEKVKVLWDSQQKARAQMYEDYCAQFGSVFQQWESDVQRKKDQDKKHMALFQQQQKMFEQMNAAQGQRLKALGQLVDHYVKSMQELQDTHEEQNTTALNNLRQEMALLQQNILINTQQKEITSIQRGLQTMLM